MVVRFFILVVKRAFLIWVLLLVLTLPWQFGLIQSLLNIMNDVVSAFAKASFSTFSTSQTVLPVSSDSILLYWHLLNMLVVALLLSFLSILLKPKLSFSLQAFVRLVARFCLIWQLALYGFDKVFRLQFYQPEPNTLFTDLGYLDLDISYWSVMGAATGYVLFLGCCELFAAFLLIFRRTRFLGALLSFGILAQVVAVNFGFDISVKVLSCFLLLLSIIVLSEYKQRLAVIFGFVNRVDELKKKQNWIAIIFGLILFLIPLAQYFNLQPKYKSAYQIEIFIKNGDTISKNKNSRINHIFEHSQGYFITKTQGGIFQDYKRLGRIDRDESITMTRYDLGKSYKFQIIDSKPYKILRGKLESNTIEMHLKELNWWSMPLLQEDFHWSVD